MRPLLGVSTDGAYPAPEQVSDPTCGAHPQSSLLEILQNRSPRAFFVLLGIANWAWVPVIRCLGWKAESPAPAQAQASCLL